VVECPGAIGVAGECSRKGSVLKKFIVLAGLGVLLAASLSGCFAMRTLQYTKDKVDAGKKTTALIEAVGQTNGDEYPFFFFESEGGSVLSNGGKFDTKGVYSGPVALRKSDALAPFASDCGSTFKGKRGVPTGKNVVVTDDPFNAHNENKFMHVKLPIKASKHSPGGDAFGISMGTWTDDGDGVPEDPGTTDDEYDCQPLYTSFILIHGGTPPGP
jgi:hypothetical protein